jgi:hypothetical protein
MSELPDIKAEYSENYRRINVAGIFGGIIAGGVEAIVYSEERRAEGVLASQPVSPDKITIKRTVEVQLIIDPIQMKSMHQWLEQQIMKYEKIFGHIPSLEEIEARTGKEPNQ